MISLNKITIQKYNSGYLKKDYFYGWNMHLPVILYEKTKIDNHLNRYIIKVRAGKENDIITATSWAGPNARNPNSIHIQEKCYNFVYNKLFNIKVTRLRWMGKKNPTIKKRSALISKLWRVVGVNC